MIKWLKSVFIPFSVIATELRIIRELYELELQSRNPPIIRVTESPSRSDTEVTFGSEMKEKSKLRKLMDGDIEEDEDDYGDIE